MVAQVIAALVPQRRAVVQAGGCAGMWPLALAKRFDHVYTFEPDPVNAACLQDNVADVANITAYACALGDQAQRVGLTRPKPGAGLWRVDGLGDIPVVVLDTLLPDIAVDALVLDVEGSELAALRGAERLVNTHRPLLWLEFTSNVAAIESWVVAHGYPQPTPAFGRDRYSVYQR